MEMEHPHVDHRRRDGLACIAGTHVPVATLLGLLAEGLTPSELLQQFPQFDDQDLRAALAFAAAVLDRPGAPIGGGGPERSARLPPPCVC